MASLTKEARRDVDRFLCAVVGPTKASLFLQRYEQLAEAADHKGWIHGGDPQIAQIWGLSRAQTLRWLHKLLGLKLIRKQSRPQSHEGNSYKVRFLKGFSRYEKAPSPFPSAKKPSCFPYTHDNKNKKDFNNKCAGAFKPSIRNEEKPKAKTETSKRQIMKKFRKSLYRLGLTEETAQRVCGVFGKFVWHTYLPEGFWESLWEKIIAFFAQKLKLGLERAIRNFIWFCRKCIYEFRSACVGDTEEEREKRREWAWILS